jgi:hypothetical protein
VLKSREIYVADNMNIIQSNLIIKSQKMTDHSTVKADNWKEEIKVTAVLRVACLHKDKLPGVRGWVYEMWVKTVGNQMGGPIVRFMHLSG